MMADQEIRKIDPEEEEEKETRERKKDVALKTQSCWKHAADFQCCHHHADITYLA